MQANNLYVKKLIKEYDWLLTEFEWKQSTCDSYDQQFKEAVWNYLETNDELKEQYKKWLESSVVLKKEHEEEESKITYSESKQLYREIAKRTHPDKNPDSDLMSKASHYYQTGDTIGLYVLATQLSIPFEVDPKIILELENEIKSLKIQASFIEQHISWLWYETPQSHKNQLVIEFVKKILT